MSVLFGNESDFTGLNFLIHQIASKGTAKFARMDQNYHNSIPKPTVESRGMDESCQNTAPRPTSNGPHEEEFISQLARRLKGLISQAVAEVKQKSQAFIELQAANNEVVRAMPVSYIIPEEYDSSILSMSEKKRKKTVVVGEIHTSFEIPEGYASYGSKLDELPMPQHLLTQIKSGARHDVGLNFLERLKGWKLQCKQRSDGKLDVYFHHLKSNEHFRSYIEVVNFILYEIFPRLLNKASKASNENFSGSNCRDGGAPKRSWSSSCSPSSREQSTKVHSTIRVTEVKELEKPLKEVFEMIYNHTTNELDNESSPHRLKTCRNKTMNDIGASTTSGEARTEDFSHSEYTQGTKQNRIEYSSSVTSTRVAECRAVSPDQFTNPSADVASEANVEVKDKMASASEPDPLENMPKPSHNLYKYDQATHLVNLKYRRLSDDDIF